MRTSTFFPAAAAAIVLAAWGLAQEPPRAARPTVEERVAALEAGFATLDTRLARANTRVGDDAGQTEIALSGRIAALERAVERLTTDVQRVERLADSANRTASQAQREAEQAAREALRR
jgi:hypothetical protein